MPDHTIPSTDLQYRTCKKCGETKHILQFQLCAAKKQDEARTRRIYRCNTCRCAYYRERRIKPEKSKSLVDTSIRTCTKCGETKPISDFDLTSSKRNGKVRVCHRGTCRVCLYKSKNEWRKRPRSHISVETKRCQTCKVEKPSSEFTLSGREVDGLSGRCKLCSKLYFEKNSTKIKQRVLDWQRNNPQKHKEKQNRWNSKNSERLKKVKLAAEQKRRTRKTLAGGSFTADEWSHLCEKYNHCCLACGERKKLDADHIVPVSKGGSSDIDNIQPLCRICNLKKNVSIIDYRPLWVEKHEN